MAQVGAQAGAMPSPRQWHLSLPILPVGVNHQYQPILGRRGAVSGYRLALTSEAQRTRMAIALQARAVGFVPRADRYYAVRIRFTFPTWQHDLDGPIKPLLDALFGSRADHRVVRIEAEKRVSPHEHGTEVWIEEWPHEV